MSLKKLVFELAAVNSSRGKDEDAPENTPKPWDVNKYHRAFVAGLMGMAGAVPGALSDFNSGNYLKACGSLLGGFVVGFAIQLGAEYGLKPKGD